MRKLLAVFFVAVLGVCVFAQKDATSRKRYALVIGNQNYKYSPISTAGADADMISESLRNKEFDVTLKKNRNNSEMKSDIDAFVKKVNADPHSVALFYFTGHAFTHDNKNYLLPINNNEIANEDDAKSYGVDIEADIAGRINTVAQIYFIDGSYENPYESKNSRALGVKGGLASSRIAKESTVGFLFSTTPNESLPIPSGKNTVFAKSVAGNIDSSLKNLSDVFSDIKTDVSKTTSGDQNPYSTATTLKFSFNGDELVALQKISAQNAADETHLKSIELNRDYQKNQDLLNAKYQVASEAANDAFNQKSAEVQEKRRLMKLQDEENRKREEERARLRSDEDNKQILALREEFQQNAALLNSSMQKNAAAADRIESIETMKGNLFEIRETARGQIKKFNIETDADTEEKVSKIMNAELKTVETDENGKITAEAKARRDRSANEIRNKGADTKAARKAQIDASVDVDNRNILPKLKNAYKNLESDTYSVTSFDDAMTVRVADYDGEKKNWRLHISVDMFGHVDVFEDDVYLGYQDVTGKKINLLDMTDAQIQEYDDDVEIYNALFRSATPVFYVKLYYKIMRWSDPSEYHIIPTKCEIVRLGTYGKKPKTIKKIPGVELNPSEFTQNPVYEIRTVAEQKDDAQRAEKLKVKEQKERGTYVDPKSIESFSASKRSADYAYNPSKSTSSSDDEKKSGRSSFHVAGIYGKTDVSDSLNSPFDNPSLIGGEVDLTISLGRFVFLGFACGIQKWDYKNAYDAFGAFKDIQSDMDSKVYYGKLNLGFNFNITSHVRPYIQGGMGFYASPFNFIDYNVSGETPSYDLMPGLDKVLGFSIGGGIDVILSKYFMITFGIDYNWMHYLRTFMNGVVDDNGEVDVKSGFMDALSNPDFHCIDFKLGFGFTW